MMVKKQKTYASPAKFSKREVEKLRQVVLESGSKRDYALVALLAYTGLRISEALNVKLEDIDFRTREIHVKDGKGEKQRTVLLKDNVINALKDYIENERAKYRTASESEYLFVSRKNKRLNRITVNKAISKYCEQESGLEGITPHQLRHFFCSHALENGWSLAEVANMAGHSNIHTTLLYTNPSGSFRNST